jgi:6 kDa early secretory antigenic target
MSRYQVDSEAVLGASGAITATTSRIQGEVASLTGQLGDLQGSWSGQASVAFAGLMADWRVTQQRVEENLRAITEALRLAGQQYADVELANARMFAG